MENIIFSTAVLLMMKILAAGNSRNSGGAL